MRALLRTCVDYEITLLQRIDQNKPLTLNLLTNSKLKYVSNDGINRNRFQCENFLKAYTFRPAKYPRANFECSVPLKC